MAEYGNYCPISLGSEVLADRWTPLIVRELVLGNTRFNDIARGLPGISRSLLVQRLKHLERKGVLERSPSAGGRGHEYRLTPAGRDLEDVLLALGRWSINWLFQDLAPGEVDPVTLTWWMHRRVDPAALPDDRVVIQFDHTAPERLSIWMVLEHRRASVCVQHPGFDPDVVVTTSTPALARVFGGYDSWASAVGSGAIGVDGPRQLLRDLPAWFLWSPFAADTRARLDREAEPAAV